MALIKNIRSENNGRNEITLFWDQPEGFNDSNGEIIITRTKDHFAQELYNTVFPNTPTDVIPISVFKGSKINGFNVGTISLSGNTLSDSSASFPTSPNLKGRLLRDQNSQVFRILSNTVNTVTLEDTPVNGKYLILSDFPSEVRPSQTFIQSNNTTSSPGVVSNLVELISGSPVIAQFESGSLCNLVFQDADGAKFFIKDNDLRNIYLFETGVTPNIAGTTFILSSFVNSSPQGYVDNFKTLTEATSRVGTGLEFDTFYYYTGFTLPIGANVAQAEFSQIDSNNSTQTSNLSIAQRQFGELMYSFWNEVDRILDTSGDLRDFTEVFSYPLNEIYSLIRTYELRNFDKVTHTVLNDASVESGLEPIGFTLGADTLRRICKDLISYYKLKGTKRGLFQFIRIITTWDITGGTGNVGDAISDFLPNVAALRFYDAALGSANTRLVDTTTLPIVGGARFVRPLPGIIIPGFFQFREFVINLPNIALFVGQTTLITVNDNTTIIEDNGANYGGTNNLVGNFILPNQEEINDIFLIIANTPTTVTVQGVLNNKSSGGTYAILSPLNTNRFITLNRLLPNQIPAGTQASFNFDV